MDFERFSQKTVKLIDQELKRLLRGWRREVGKIDKSLLPVVDKFIKANEGGKKIRGILVVLGFQLVQNVILRESSTEGSSMVVEDSSLIVQNDKHKSQNDIYRVAAAYEIFHTAILAHDDIMDQDPIRRGQPSLYQALGGDHKGISQAICLGDAGFFLAFRIISEQSDSVKALRWVSQIMLDTAIGQILDIEKADALEVAKLKTAKYTVSGPLVLGAILAGADERLLGMLGVFGETLGIAFQIRDDILDSEVSWIGGSDQAKKEAEKYRNKAIKLLPQLTKDEKMRKILEQLGEYLVKRNK